MDRVRLIGLDFGTTTSSAVAASACVRRNAVNARMEFSELQEIYRSPMVLTPFRDDRLDLEQVAEYLDLWLAESQASGTDAFFGGGALLTGLAAQADNAEAVAALVRRRLGDGLIARADDPCLESWLAFMGNCASLSRTHAGQPFLNLDIGGGTTNLAVGQGGEVLATGCLFVGARHFQVMPGTYRIVRLSPYARALLQHLGLAKNPGDDMSLEDVGKVLDFYMEMLEAAVTGRKQRLDSAVARMHVQVDLRATPGSAALTLSGGVGELVYRHLRGEPWPGTTAFGDLGIDLAKRLAANSFWAGHLRRFQPSAGGRATVFGLLRHSTHVSGSTVFLRHPEDLPLRDVPILGTIADHAAPEHLAEMIRLACGSPRGAGFRLVIEDRRADSVKALAQRLAEALRNQAYPPDRPLVFFVGPNIGKVLGQYVTAWGASPWHVMVIDEIDCAGAQYAHIGALHDQVIPVSFFGLQQVRPTLNISPPKK